MRRRQINFAASAFQPPHLVGWSDATRRPACRAIFSLEISLIYYFINQIQRSYFSANEKTIPFNRSSTPWPCGVNLGPNLEHGHSDLWRRIQVQQLQSEWQLLGHHDADLRRWIPLQQLRPERQFLGHSHSDVRRRIQDFAFRILG